MSEKTKFVRDAFAFSLGGMTAVTPFVLSPAIADDLINRIRDDRLNRLRDELDHLQDQNQNQSQVEEENPVQEELDLIAENVDRKWPSWLRRRRRAA